MSQPSIKALKLAAAKARRQVVRMVAAGGAGHMGGAMSCIDIATALYFYKMNIDPKNPKYADRDRFILSAGHKCMAQYAVLAERGFFDPAILDTYGSLHAKIPGHPDMHKLPGVEANTGALGHGLAIALGMAMGLRIDRSDAKVYVIMGDGELAEGSNWEAAAAAAHHKADNLVAIVDFNGLQIAGRTADVMSFEPIRDHFAAFGWEAVDIDGNDMQEIVQTLDALPLTKGKPSLIVAHTVKAKGLSFAEGKAAYHYWKPNPDELQRAIEELEAAIEEVGA